MKKTKKISWKNVDNPAILLILSTRVTGFTLYGMYRGRVELQCLSWFREDIKKSATLPENEEARGGLECRFLSDFKRRESLSELNQREVGGGSEEKKSRKASSGKKSSQPVQVKAWKELREACVACRGPWAWLTSSSYPERSALPGSESPLSLLLLLLLYTAAAAAAVGAVACVLQFHAECEEGAETRPPSCTFFSPFFSSSSPSSFFFWDLTQLLPFCAVAIGTSVECAGWIFNYGLRIKEFSKTV